jgi:hypothetical protein
MVGHTSLVQVWLAPLGRGLSAHQTDGALTVVIHGPHTAAMTALVDRRDLRIAARHRGAGSGPESATRQVDAHIAAGPDETDPRLMSAADVIVRRAGSGNPGPHSRSEIRARFPGCLVAAVVDRDRTCVWAGDPGQQIQLTSLPATRPALANPRRKRPRADADILCCASVVHAWLVAGRPLVGLDAAHLVVSRTTATRRRGVRVNLTCRDPDRVAEEAAWQVGC